MNYSLNKQSSIQYFINIIFFLNLHTMIYANRPSPIIINSWLDLIKAFI